MIDGMWTKVNYDWDVESYEECGDIEDHHFYTRLSDIRGPIAINENLVLVRDIWCEDGDLLDRAYAYVEDGELSEDFDNGVRVPKRFHKEFQRFNNNKG